MSFPKKVILHVDMDAFFSSVEQHDNPELRGQPVIVGSQPDQRGVVSAASYEARKFGIHSAMPSRIAFKKCPSATFIRPRMERYKEVSMQIMRVFESFTPHIQPLSIDEAFLDVSGSQHLFGSGMEIAKKVRAAILKETGLTASVGVAPNLFLAKLASDMNKPDGITLMPFKADKIAAFLEDFPIKRMWGAGKVTQKKLESLGFSTFKSIQNCDIQVLEKAVGKTAAPLFYQRAYGIDNRALVNTTKEKSISNEITFGENTSDRAQIEEAYKALIDKVSYRLRKANYYATTVHLRLRWDDFKTITRQMKLSPPCCDEITLREKGMELLNANITSQPLRLIGFGVSGLTQTDRTAQLSLFESPDTTLHDKRKRLSTATDAIKAKYGIQSVQRASALKSDPAASKKKDSSQEDAPTEF